MQTTKKIIGFSVRPCFELRGAPGGTLSIEFTQKKRKSHDVSYSLVNLSFD